MLKCPECKKEVSELDEVCPHCGIMFSDDMGMERTDDKNENAYSENNNAYYLNIMAYINLVLFCVASIVTFMLFSKSAITDEISLYGIAGGISILIIGFTQFFLLRTIVDIYNK